MTLDLSLPQFTSAYMPSFNSKHLRISARTSPVNLDVNQIHSLQFSLPQHLNLSSLRRNIQQDSSLRNKQMPPKTSKYGKGPDGYSTNPATRRVRARIAKFDPEQREAHRIYTREYTALWQACNRFARRDEYKRAPVKQRRQMLLNHLRGIIEKRFVHPILLYLRRNGCD